MDWRIKSIAKKSSHSGVEFRPGDRVVCLVFKDVEAVDLDRADLLEGELEGYRPSGEVLGRWVRVVKEPGDETGRVRETMASAEDFFFSLFENEEPEAREESEALKHLLALMLERKRVLRAVPPRRTGGAQLYRHVRRGAEVAVPIVEISPDLMGRIEDTVGELML